MEKIFLDHTEWIPDKMPIMRLFAWGTEGQLFLK